MADAIEAGKSTVTVEEMASAPAAEAETEAAEQPAEAERVPEEVPADA
jgi:hypothetical protein